LKEFINSGSLRDVAVAASSATDFDKSQVFARIFGMLRFVAIQYWEEKKKTLLSSSRLRTYLLRRDIAKEFKEQIWDANGRVRLDKPWKPDGITFIDSLPDIRRDSERSPAKKV